MPRLNFQITFPPLVFNLENWGWNYWKAVYRGHHHKSSWFLWQHFGMSQGRSQDQTFKSLYLYVYLTQRVGTGAIVKIYLSSIEMSHHDYHGNLFGVKIMKHHGHSQG